MAHSADRRFSIPEKVPSAGSKVADRGLQQVSIVAVVRGGVDLGLSCSVFTFEAIDLVAE